LVHALDAAGLLVAGARDLAHDGRHALHAGHRVPTLVLHGAEDPCNAASTSEGKNHLFTGPYRRELIERCGHFPQREHPEQVSRRVLAWLQECSA
jgi:pimeloyl-ACP methyl ester carboxylesterase